MQKITVNGIDYDSPDAMPPDVRRQYERALQAIKDLNTGSAPGGPKKTVTSVPGGLSINVEERRVHYSIDGKTYDDPEQLPPEVRARLANLEVHDQNDQSPPEVRIAQVHIETRPQPGTGRLLWWLLIAAIAALVIGSFL